MLMNHYQYDLFPRTSGKLVPNRHHRPVTVLSGGDKYSPFGGPVFDLHHHPSRGGWAFFSEIVGRFCGELNHDFSGITKGPEIFWTNSSISPETPSRLTTSSRILKKALAAGDRALPFR